MATLYSIDFARAAPFTRKYLATRHREKVKTVFQSNPGKIVELLIPSVMSLLGVIFFSWNLLQIVVVFYIDFLLHSIFLVLKIFLNKNAA
ncbi:MAG: hypothetical protein ACOCXT_05070, partial [Candidatus Dojkabacteria bacterium]